MSRCATGSSWTYQKQDIIGKGRFGFVYTAKVCNDENQPSFAVKEMYFREYLPDDSAKWQDLLYLVHSNILRYHKVTCYKDQLKGGTVELLMDYIPDGDLFNFVNTTINTTNRLPLVKLADFTNQIACGLVFLHNQNIVHSDLKPAHILLRRRRPQWDYQLYISGLEQRIILQLDVTAIPVVHLRESPRFMSPETVQACIHGESNKNILGKESDIWSLGCIMIFLFDCHSGKKGNLFYRERTKEFLVLKEDSDPAVLLRAAQGFLPAIPYDVPHDLAEIIQGCLVVEKRLRPTASLLVSSLTQYQDRKRTVMAKDIRRLPSSEHDKLISCQELCKSSSEIVAAAAATKGNQGKVTATWQRVVKENIYCTKAAVIAVAALGFVIILLMICLQNAAYYHFPNILPITLFGFLCVGILISLAFLVRQNKSNTELG